MNTFNLGDLVRDAEDINPNRVCEVFGMKIEPRLDENDQIERGEVEYWLFYVRNGSPREYGWVGEGRLTSAFVADMS